MTCKTSDSVLLWKRDVVSWATRVKFYLFPEAHGMISKPQFYFTIFISLAFPVAAHAQSFSNDYQACRSSADGAGDMLAVRNCLYAETDKQDLLLNASYQCLRERTKDAKALRDQQRAWIAETDQNCATPLGNYLDAQLSRALCRLEAVEGKTTDLANRAVAAGCTVPEIDDVRPDLGLWQVQDGWASVSNLQGQVFSVACSRGEGTLQQPGKANEFENASFINALVYSSGGDLQNNLGLQSGTNVEGHLMEVPAFTQSALASGSTVTFQAQDHNGFGINGLSATFALRGSSRALNECAGQVAVPRNPFGRSTPANREIVVGDSSNDAPARDGVGTGLLPSAQETSDEAEQPTAGSAYLSGNIIGSWQEKLVDKDGQSRLLSIQTSNGRHTLSLLCIEKNKDSFFNVYPTTIWDGEGRLFEGFSVTKIELLRRGRVLFWWTEDHNWPLLPEHHISVPFEATEDLMRSDTIRLLGRGNQVLATFPTDGAGRALPACDSETPFTTSSETQRATNYVSPVDILGLRVGVSLGEAQRALDELGGHWRGNEVRKDSFTRRGEMNGSETSFSGSVEQIWHGSTEKKRDEIRLHLSTEVLDNQVMGITRRTSYLTNQSPTVEAFIASLDSKYGEPSLLIEDDAPYHTQVFWVFDEDGAAVHESNIAPRCAGALDELSGSYRTSWTTDNSDLFFRKYGEDMPQCRSVLTLELYTNGTQVDNFKFELWSLSLMKQAHLRMQEFLDDRVSIMDEAVRRQLEGVQPEL